MEGLRKSVCIATMDDAGACVVWLDERRIGTTDELPLVSRARPRQPVRSAGLLRISPRARRHRQSRNCTRSINAKCVVTSKT